MLRGAAAEADSEVQGERQADAHPVLNQGGQIEAAFVVSELARREAKTANHAY